VDQILRTEAKVVATGCLSCMSTLHELKKHHKLDVEITTVADLASKALVLS
jgi:Fe-S oxidoreductase